MTHYEEDGREYRPGEEHIASMLCFDCLWSDLLEGYVMRADWYHAAGLDTDTPQYRPEKHLLAEQIEEPLMPGLSNETWSVRLTDAETGAAFFAALTNRNSLLVRMPYEKNGGEGVRTVTYMRYSGFLPPTLENAMTGEPEKSLIFYWRDPPAEVTEPLSVIPMNALEPNGQNKLLLVGRWYETDIQFSVGTPVLNDDGTQQSWISEKVVYEGKIKINEPMFFSLTIPEDTARVCLFMKRPWDVSWFTWPITDQTPFYVSGDTFLTGGS